MSLLCNDVFWIWIQNTVYTMDLRSAHKTPEKPPPQLHLSLTRSLVPEDEDEAYSDCGQDAQPQMAYCKSKSRKSHFRCLDSNPPSPTEEDWEGRGEEEEEEDVDVEEDMEEEEETVVAQKETTEKSVGIFNGKCVSRSDSGL